MGCPKAVKTFCDLLGPAAEPFYWPLVNRTRAYLRQHAGEQNNDFKISRNRSHLGLK